MGVGEVEILTTLGPIIIMILMISVPLFVIIRLFRRMEARAEERLKLDREQISFQKNQLKASQELNRRLINIENMLKEVE
jgi:heme/copper-type cytochrome/quinol oxidase subunit 2